MVSYRTEFDLRVGRNASHRLAARSLAEPIALCWHKKRAPLRTTRVSHFAYWSEP